jgi:glutamate carboxypeptidase
MRSTARLFRLPSLAALAALLAAGPGHAQRNQALYEQAALVRPDAVKLLERLVNTDSGTFSESGLAQVGAIVEQELKALGAQVERVPAAPALGANIVARLHGKGRGRILLMAHMDTVFADGAAKARPFRIEGQRAYGPGVMDNKGGIVTAIAALKMLRASKFDGYADLTVFINTNEETGSRGSRELIETLARSHDVVLNLEPGREPDGLVVERKGAAVINLEVKGKAAHAGIAPEQGRNAAMEAAHQVLQLSKLGDADKRTTVNVTVLKAGERSNVIPDAASAQADVRVAQPGEYQRLERDLARLSANKSIADTQVTATLAPGSPPMARTGATDALAARAAAIYAELGRELSLQSTGGAADANYSAGAGVPTIDGLGVVGGAIHTPDEYADLDSFAPRFYLLARLIMELGSRPAVR